LTKARPFLAAQELTIDLLRFVHKKSKKITIAKKAQARTTDIVSAPEVETDRLTLDGVIWEMTAAVAVTTSSTATSAARNFTTTVLAPD